MKNESIWLRTSLFVNKPQWAYVLHNGIKPFIEQCSIGEMIEALMIEFNFNCGENIRFAIKLPLQNAETGANEIDSFFKPFFAEAKLPAKDIILPVQGLFLPFPSNTIQYGLYNSLFDTDPLIIKIVSKTSACIIDALSEEIIDEEMLIMLAFYFHCALITQVNETTYKDLSHIYNTEVYSIDGPIITEEFLSEKYEDNKASLTEIEESIRNYQSSECYDNPPWLISWMMTCKEVLIDYNAKNDDPATIIVKSINKQLGLTSNMQKLVHYFIKGVHGHVFQQ